jgi:predicted nucleic acid-binding protein
VNGFLLDTNVLSELERDRPTRAVDDWFSSQPADGLFIAAVTVGEIGAGLEVLAPGRRRARLQAWLDDLIESQFAGRVLPYDTEAARAFGPLVARACDPAPFVGPSIRRILSRSIAPAR